MNERAPTFRAFVTDALPPKCPSVARVVADLQAEHIAAVATRAASYAQKAATAARRGNRTATAVRLRQAHLCTVEAIRSFRADLGLPEDAPS